MGTGRFLKDTSCGRLLFKIIFCFFLLLFLSLVGQFHCVLACHYFLFPYCKASWLLNDSVKHPVGFLDPYVSAKFFGL